MSDKTESIRSLFRHYRWSMLLKEHYDALRKRPEPEGELGRLAWLEILFGIRSYWYASLYVVIEGWKELKPDDAEVNELLKEQEYLDRLRLHRNCVFHFQADYFDSRLMDFLEHYESTARWASSVDNALARYFDMWFKSRGVTGEVKIESGRLVVSIEVLHN